MEPKKVAMVRIEKEVVDLPQNSQRLGHDSGQGVAQENRVWKQSKRALHDRL